MSAFGVHCGSSSQYTNAWPSGYVKPSDRAALDRIHGLLDEQAYKVCERCVCFVTARGKLDRAMNAGAIPRWIPDEYGFCRMREWDTFEMVPRKWTCEDWEER